MILDTLLHWRRYAGLSPRFPAAFEFLEGLGANVETGRHELDGDNLFALVQAYTTKPAADAQFEAHRRYIDIQCVLSGQETIFWAPLAGLRRVASPYDEKADIIFFPLEPPALPVRVGTGQFAILFPDDAHAPGRVWESPGDVVKVVVKVRV